MKIKSMLVALPLAGSALGVACSDSKPSSASRLKVRHDPLLGMRSDAVITHLRSTCPWQFYSRRNLVLCDRDLGVGRESYEVRFDEHSGRINGMSMLSFKDVDQALDTFDIAFAPILPKEVRAPIRASILDPEHFSLRMRTGYIDLYTGMPEATGKTFAWSVMDEPFVDGAE